MTESEGMLASNVVSMDSWSFIKTHQYRYDSLDMTYLTTPNQINLLPHGSYLTLSVLLQQVS